jgi:polysaccharide export outer membrane protein
MKLRLAFLLLVLAVPRLLWAQAETEYKPGPEDVLHIQVVGRPDLGGDAIVDPSGNLELPLLGMVKAVDRTTSELASQLSQRYNILDSKISQVLVAVSQYNSRRVTVVGEVRSPGRYGFRTIPGLWEILLGAGGATPAADLSQVEIVRKESDTAAPQVITVDLSAGVKGTNPDSLPKLRPKDTVVVPSLSREAASTGSTFQVLGSVRTPGVYRLTAAKTVVEALAISGGSLPDADLRNVHLTRKTGGGVVAYQLDIEGHLRRGEPAADLELKAGDTVMVPARGGANFFNRLLGIAPLATVITSLIVVIRR